MERLCASCGSAFQAAPVTVRRTAAGQREYVHASECEVGPPLRPVEPQVVRVPRTTAAPGPRPLLESEDTERRLERDQVISTGTGGGKTPYGSGTVYGVRPTAASTGRSAGS